MCYICLLPYSGTKYELLTNLWHEIFRNVHPIHSESTRQRTVRSRYPAVKTRVGQIIVITIFNLIVKLLKHYFITRKLLIKFIANMLSEMPFGLLTLAPASTSSLTHSELPPSIADTIGDMITCGSAIRTLSWEMGYLLEHHPSP